MGKIMQRQKGLLHLYRSLVAEVVIEGAISFQIEEGVVQPPPISKESKETVTSPAYWSDRWVAAELDDI